MTQGPAVHGRGPAAPGRRVRPQQQVGALSAWTGAAETGARRAMPRRSSRSPPRSATRLSSDDGAHSQHAWQEPCYATPPSRGARSGVAFVTAPPAAVQPTRHGRSTFTDVADTRRTARAESIYGGVDRKRFIIETNGAGVAWIDWTTTAGWTPSCSAGTRLADGQRARRSGDRRARESTTRVYRNRRDGTFADVTERIRARPDHLGVVDLRAATTTTTAPRPPRHGVRHATACTAIAATDGSRTSARRRACRRRDAVGIRLLISRLRPRRRARSLRRELPGLRSRDRDRARPGRELPVEGHPGQLRPQGPADRHQPAVPQPGRRHFDDVSEASGIARVTGRYPMTVVAADFDEDGWVDIYVASDSTAAILYRNNRDGTFTDVAVAERHGVQRERHGAGGHGRRRRRHRRRRPPRSRSRRILPTTSRRSSAPLGGGLFEDVAMAAGSGRAEPVCRVGRRNRRISTTTAGRTCSTSPATSTPRSSGSSPTTRTRAPHRLPEPRRRDVRRRERAGGPRSRRRRARAAAPPSATSTTTATWTCLS